MSNREKIKKKSNWHHDIPLTSLGWQLAIPIVGGAFLGYQLDQSFPNQFAFTLIFTVLGIFVGYYNIYKIIELETLRADLARRRSNNEDFLQ